MKKIPNRRSSPGSSFEQEDHTSMGIPELDEQPSLEVELGKMPADKSTILVTGANGQLGHAVTKLWSRLTDEELGRLLIKPKESLNIADMRQVESQLEALRPNVVVNCAGFTDTSKAEEATGENWKTNVLGPANLAKVCAKLEIGLIHISSDFVFGEDKSWLIPVKDPEDPGYGRARCCKYTEDAVLGGTGRYGQAKVASEHMILREASEHSDFRYWIVRTAGLYELPWRKANNFPSAIATSLFRQHGEIPVVADAFTSITRADHLASAICWMAAWRDAWTSKGPMCPSGIYHIANTGATSWFEVAKRIAYGLGFPPERIVKTTRDAYMQRRGEVGSGALCTCLDTTKYESLRSPQMPTWASAIDDWCKQAKVYFR